MENIENVSTLAELPLGGRMLFRSRKDWRMAVISQISEQQITISVLSPRGRSYTIRRDPDFEVLLREGVSLLRSDANDVWQENYPPYDRRW